MLREDRERSGLTVDEIAWRLSVSRREYRELEAGTRFPTFELGTAYAGCTGGRAGSNGGGPIDKSPRGRWSA